jgi:hypothetical protein
MIFFALNGLKAQRQAATQDLNLNDSCVAARAALGLVVRLRVAILPHHAIAIWRAPTADHHVAVLLFTQARHAARHLLKAKAMGGA